MLSEQIKQPQKADAFRIDVDMGNVLSHSNGEIGAMAIDVPAHIQPALDMILDHYAQTGAKPEIKLCGNPLDIVSDFITKMQETLPAYLVNNGKDVMDFMIREICDFCRSRAMNHMTLQFRFDRSCNPEPC